MQQTKVGNNAHCSNEGWPDTVGVIKFQMFKSNNCYVRKNKLCLLKCERGGLHEEACASLVGEDIFTFLFIFLTTFSILSCSKYHHPSLHIQYMDTDALRFLFHAPNLCMHQIVRHQFIH